jgi:hypothetical protein
MVHSRCIIPHVAISASGAHAHTLTRLHPVVVPRLRIIFQCSHCPLSTTKLLSGRLDPNTRNTSNRLLRVLPLPTARLLPQEDVPRGPPHQPMITPAVNSVPRPKKRQGCEPVPPILNGDGTDGTAAVSPSAEQRRAQGFPAVLKLAVWRSYLGKPSWRDAHMQVPSSFHVNGRDDARRVGAYLRSSGSLLEGCLLC